MTNRWMDGFEMYDGFGLSTGYALNGGGIHTSTGGRGGGKMAGGGATRIWVGPLAIPPGVTTFVGVTRFNGEELLFTDHNFNRIVEVQTNSLDQLTVLVGAGTVIVDHLYVGMRTVNVARYFEHQMQVIDATHIAYECKIDELIVSPLHTYTVPALPLTMMELVQVEGGPGIDDLYVNDSVGPAPDNTYWGDTRMFAIGPISDSAVTWVPSSGLTNFNMVNETSTDYDSTYVRTGTVGNKDLYNYPNTGLPGGTTIRGVAVMTIARRLADSGPRQLKAVLKSGSTEVQGPLHQLSDTYYTVQFRLPTDPATGLSWTVAGVNNLKAGQILIA